MSIATSPKIPADLQAEVRSVSAVGEQYVDLRPRTDSGPYLQNGSVITAENTTHSDAGGPVLDRVSKLVGTFPKDRLSAICSTRRTRDSTAPVTISARCWTPARS